MIAGRTEMLQCVYEAGKRPDLMKTGESFQGKSGLLHMSDIVYVYLLENTIGIDVMNTG
jgi:hypothetical protein